MPPVSFTVKVPKTFPGYAAIPNNSMDTEGSFYGFVVQFNEARAADLAHRLGTTYSSSQFPESPVTKQIEAHNAAIRRWIDKTPTPTQREDNNAMLKAFEIIVLRKHIEDKTQEVLLHHAPLVMATDADTAKEALMLENAEILKPYIGTLRYIIHAKG